MVIELRVSVMEKLEITVADTIRKFSEENDISLTEIWATLSKIIFRVGHDVIVKEVKRGEKRFLRNEGGETKWKKP